MAQELILIRGLPGSGKSTFAKIIKKAIVELHYEGCYHFEADQFFDAYVKNDNDGYDLKYIFVPEKLSQAHGWCQQNTWDHLNSGYSVIVSNTFSRVWEMRPYIDMADKLDIKLTVITCEGKFGNVHNVPEETIQKMKDRWERYEG